jgi:multiple sugar transport system substrate-binding protein/sn-glycerol 3-phosphate transport system substrate-binding protein
MKRAAQILWLIGFSTWLAYCGGGQEEKGPGAAVNLEELDLQDQEIVFWYQHTREREEAMLALIEDFNRANPHGITVRGEYAGNYGDIYNKMMVGLQGGALPNLLVAYQNQAQVYYLADGVVDLTPYMNSPKWGLSPEARQDYFQSFVNQDNVDGVQVGFPPNRSMEILYYNVDWLRELGYEGPPRTWEEFAEMCRKAHAQPFSRSERKARSLGFLIEADASRLASMVFSRGGDFMNPAGTAYTLNTSEAREAMQMVQNLVEEGAVELLSERYGDTRDFSVGQVLCAIRSSSGLPFFKSGVSSGLGFEWNVGPLPHTGKQPVMNAYGASVSVCRTTPEQQLAAWLFVKWLTEPEQQARWVRASNYFPVRRSTARELDDYFEKNPRYRTAYELLDYGKSEPAVVGYEPVRRLIAQSMVEIVEGTEVGPVLERLERNANATLEEE